MENKNNLFRLISKYDDSKVYANDSGAVVRRYNNGKIEAPHSIDLEMILENPEMYIEKGCIEACKNLWSLNICTIESQGYEENSYIYLGKLSKRNMEIFTELAKKDPKHYKLPEGEDEETLEAGEICQRNKFPYSCKIESKGEIDTALIEPFEIQDMYEGVFTIDEIMDLYYVKYDLDEYGNLKIAGHIKTKEEAIKELEEKGYIYRKEDGKIYKSKFYLDRHLEYIKRTDLFGI